VNLSTKKLGVGGRPSKLTLSTLTNEFLNASYIQLVIFLSI
jgi:hypothetical protein